MDGNVSCKVCTHYHHNGDQYLCDAGVFDVRVAGKAVIEITQDECAFEKYHQALAQAKYQTGSGIVKAQGVFGSEINKEMDKRTKAYKEQLNARQTRV